MDSVALIIAFAAVFALVHLLLIGYLYRKGKVADGVPSVEEAIDTDPDVGFDSDVEPTETGGIEAGDEIRCSTCGCPNDPSYQFCKQCVSELGPEMPMGGADGGTGRPET
ncbi:MAG: hypothetical protein PPP58_11695 [Natronomonas sp.]